MAVGEPVQSLSRAIGQDARDPAAELGLALHEVSSKLLLAVPDGMSRAKILLNSNTN